MLAGSAQLALAMPEGLPPVQHAGGISYLSGGVGSDESTAIKGEMGNYPLVLEFAGKTNAGNDYLADIPVQISDAHGTVVLDTSSRGPFILISLPNGRYTVTAIYNGKQVRRAVSVVTGAHAHEVFIWPM
ncbi:carboxypeptidase regulatory-like domain-containing protein [Paraburkholderia nemoris]|uniref:carboxypeptidase regulatory-like domain-containing protein n=1 Tax=Paraburkholderia nemoris TaxID=2793076 RepID=UPI0038B8094B